MDQAAIFEPFLILIILTIVVWFYMYARRIPFILKSKMELDKVTASEFTQISPPSVLNPSDNLKNLFETPTLFYAMSLFLFVTEQVDEIYLFAAWVFVVLRIVHSLIHCTVNVVIVRFYVYAASSLTLWFIVGRAALSAIAQ